MKTTLGLILLLFATLFSCIRQEKTLPVELSRAESVMWEYPDSLNIVYQYRVLRKEKSLVYARGEIRISLLSRCRSSKY